MPLFTTVLPSQTAFRSSVPAPSAQLSPSKMMSVANTGIDLVEAEVEGEVDVEVSVVTVVRVVVVSVVSLKLTKICTSPFTLNDTDLLATAACASAASSGPFNVTVTTTFPPTLAVNMESDGPSLRARARVHSAVILMMSPWVSDDPSTRAFAVASATVSRSTLTQSTCNTNRMSVGATGVVLVKDVVEVCVVVAIDFSV